MSSDLNKLTALAQPKWDCEGTLNKNTQQWGGKSGVRPEESSGLQEVMHPHSPPTPSQIPPSLGQNQALVGAVPAMRGGLRLENSKEGKPSTQLQH